MTQYLRGSVFYRTLTVIVENPKIRNIPKILRKIVGVSLAKFVIYNLDNWLH